MLHGAKRSVLSFPSVLSVALRDPVLTAPVGVEAEPTSATVGLETGEPIDSKRNIRFRIVFEAMMFKRQQ